MFLRNILGLRSIIQCLNSASSLICEPEVDLIKLESKLLRSHPSRPGHQQICEVANNKTIVCQFGNTQIRYKVDPLLANENCILTNSNVLIPHLTPPCCRVPGRAGREPPGRVPQARHRLAALHQLRVRGLLRGAELGAVRLHARRNHAREELRHHPRHAPQQEAQVSTTLCRCKIIFSLN